MGFIFAFEKAAAAEIHLGKDDYRHIPWEASPIQKAAPRKTRSKLLRRLGIGGLLAGAGIGGALLLRDRLGRKDKKKEKKEKPFVLSKPVHRGLATLALSTAVGGGAYAVNRKIRSAADAMEATSTARRARMEAHYHGMDSRQYNDLKRSARAYMYRSLQRNRQSKVGLGLYVAGTVGGALLGAHALKKKKKSK